MLTPKSAKRAAFSIENAVESAGNGCMCTPRRFRALRETTSEANMTLSRLSSLLKISNPNLATRTSDLGYLLKVVALTTKRIVQDQSGPTPFYVCAQQVATAVGMADPDTARVSYAVRALLEMADDPDIGLRFPAGSTPEMGYVFDASNPDAYPISTMFLVEKS